MRRLVCLAFCVVSVMFQPAEAAATVCSSGPSPASSLVFPFVVLDYSNSNTTIIGITNTGPEAQIVHVTVWTDYGASILSFNIVLSGYDLETINIRDLLVDGILPISADPEGSDPLGGAIARGPVTPATPLPVPNSSASIFDRCNSGSHQSVPSAYSVPIGAGALDIFKSYLQMSQTQDRFHQSCGGSSYSLGDWYELRDTDDPTWMWITADVVWTCNKLLPDSDSNYWLDGPTQNPSYSQEGAQRFVANVLIGDVTWVDSATGDSQSSPAIPILTGCFSKETVGIITGKATNMDRLPPSCHRTPPAVAASAAMLTPPSIRVITERIGLRT